MSVVAADGASFSGLIEKVDGEARASYTVSVTATDRGAENGSQAFSTEREATAWIEREATSRGFTSYSLSIKYPPNGSSTAVLERDMVGLSHRWRL